MPPFSPDRRRRRNRRLTVLGLTLVVAIGLLVGLGLFMRARTATAAHQRVVDSVVAFEQEDYERVVELLEDTNTNTNTIRTTAGDPEALWRYVVARREVELRHLEHYALLFPALQQVVALDPGNLEAGYLLLDLLMADTRNTEALDTAGRLIAAHPGEVELLRIRYALNMRLNRSEEALRDALAATLIEPLYVPTQIDVAKLTKQLNHDPTEYHQRAEALLELHPEDPRAEVILAQAWLHMGHLIEGQELLTRAIGRDAPDDEFIRVLVEILDGIERFVDSYTYLKRSVGSGLEGPLESELFLRDFEAQNYADVVGRAATLSQAETHANILALTAISHHHLGQTDEAQQLLAALQGRTDEPLAQHWAACLSTMWDDTQPAAQHVAACAAACEDNPNHAYFHFFLAEAYRGVGEVEAAMIELAVTRKHRPSWAHPFYLTAEILLALGRNEEAADTAHDARLRRPTLPHATTFAVAQARAVDVNDERAVDRALSFIDDKVQADHPNEPRTYAAAVDLLARAGQTQQAADRIRRALEQAPPLTQPALLELAATSQRYELGLASAVFDTARAAYGADPRVVLEQATAAAQNGSNQDAITLLQNATPSPATRPWRVAEAQLLARLEEPDALDAWARLADDFPEDLEIQRIALDAVGVRHDRAFADRVIQRLQSLGGPDSVGWKIERARYLLGSEDPAAHAGEAEGLLRQAISTAPNRVVPYRLLARCQSLLGDDVAAARSITQAANLDPSDMHVQFQLGQLLNSQEEFTAARQPLLRVARNEGVAPDIRFDALVMLSQQGERETLIPILEAMRLQYVAPDAQEILLAQLYTATGRSQDADTLCELMLQNPTPQSIAYCSEHYWQTGKNEEAQRIIDLIDTVEMTDALRHTILGQHAARMEQVDTALDHYRAAAQADPTQANQWERLVALALVFGRAEVAIADAKAALVHLPDDPGMRTIADNADLLSALVANVRFRTLAASLVGEPAHRGVGLQALRRVAEAVGPGGSITTVASDLSALANANPAYLQLQNLTAGLYSELGQYVAAAEIATRTMNNFPADGTSARLATIALAETGQWRRALNAAQDWTRRVPSQRPMVDSYLAAAQRNLGRVDDALKTIEPHIAMAQADPARYPRLLAEYATCLTQRGRTEQAWQVLAPNLSVTAMWRELAMTLAGSVVPDSATASRWLEAIETAIPQDASQERLLLAQSIFTAGDRLGAQAMIDRARAMIEQATQSADAPLAAWFLRARVAEQRGDLADAEASYRQVLLQQPDFTLAQNNLAMLLAVRGRDLDEAITLARSASASQPDDPNVHDTLAHVLSRAGKHDDALRAIEMAIGLDIENPQWVHSKADLLEAAGRDDEANELRQRHGLVPGNG